MRKEKNSIGREIERLRKGTGRNERIKAGIEKG